MISDGQSNLDLGRKLALLAASFNADGVEPHATRLGDCLKVSNAIGEAVFVEIERNQLVLWINRPDAEKIVVTDRYVSDIVALVEGMLDGAR